LVKSYGRDGAFLAYADEDSCDRDVNGALWARYSLAQGKGQAQFESVHALRQRNAMRRSLCQVCRNSVLGAAYERELFLFKGTGNSPVIEGERTSAPPVCRECALVAVQLCPELKLGFTAAWVGHRRAWGVAGVVHDLDTLRPVPGRDLVEVSYPDPLIRRVIAYRLVETLHDCTPVDLATLQGA
jgi:hypothetical protein